MDASNGLLGILGVHFIFCLAVLFGDGEDTQSFQGFEWVGRSWVKHADTAVEKVADIEKPQSQYDTDQGSLYENRCRSQDWWSRWDSNPPAVWKQRSFAVQPDLLRYSKERDGILTAR